MFPAAVTAIVGLIDWKALLKKCANDSAAGVAKAGGAGFLRLLQPDEGEKAVKQAVLLFTEEFLKELEDKLDLSAALEGYQDQLRRR